jgi:hypothetical protein
MIVRVCSCLMLMVALTACGAGSVPTMAGQPIQLNQGTVTISGARTGSLPKNEQPIPSLLLGRGSR